MDILSDLTPAQREAVTHKDGPLLVLAGAGSGKTRVITRRIAYLLAEDVPARRILAITFTNKAAGEMQERTDALVPGSRVPLVTTFHSFCARMLREYGDLVGVDPRFTIYDTADQKAAIKRALAELELDPTRFNPDTILATISRAKNRLQRSARFAERGGSDWAARKLARVYTAYEELLRDAHALDFDDLLLEMALGLRDRPELAEALHDRFHYILIDEYQDTNHAQYVIARDLAGPRRNLCATGDPDQSIYGWRGAELSNILDFEKDFPETKVVRLERNYRSTKTILAAASGVIRCNRSRKEKALHTENPRGDPIRVVLVDDEEAEARSVVRRIGELKNAGLAYGDMAVFVRTAALMRALEDAFRSGRPPVPYEVVRGTSFYERKEVRDILAYLQVLHNPRDSVNLRRIINTPSRGIGEKTLEILQAWAAREGVSLLQATRHVADIPELPTRARGAVHRFGELMTELFGEPTDSMGDLLDAVITKTRYDKSVESEPGRLENLGELVTLGANFDNRMAEVPEEAARPGLEGFLETVNLSSDQDAWDEAPDRVPLMTLHAAKGLEFPAVFVPACEEGLLPHANSRETDAQVEEERRLFFVGMTRAQRHLTLLKTRLRRVRGRLERCMPSRFLHELPRDTIRIENEETGTSPADAGGRPSYRAPGAQAPVRKERDAETGLSVGEIVRHRTYGQGRVVRFQTQGGRRMVRIHFATVGEKLMDPGYAKLKRVRRA